MIIDNHLYNVAQSLLFHLLPMQNSLVRESLFDEARLTEVNEIKISLYERIRNERVDSYNSILISGSYGTGNLGDSKILEGLTQLCQEQYLPEEVIASSIVPEATLDITSVDRSIPAIERSPLSWISTVRDVDLIILGGGTVINHDSFARRHSVITLIAYLLNKDIYVIAGATGESGLSAKLSRHYLNLTDAIAVRDKRSKRIVRSMGIEEPVDVVPDPGLVPTPTESEADFDLPDRYVLVCIRSLNRDRFVDTVGIALGLDEISQSSDTKIIFFPFKQDDIEISTSVASQMITNPSVFEEMYTIAEAESIIDRAEAVVAMRLHSMILAAHMRTPFTPISYLPKCDQFLQQIGVAESFSPFDIDGEQLASNIQDNLRDQTPISDSGPQIRALEENCWTIFDQCDSQKRESDPKSAVSLASYVPVVVLQQLLN